MRIIPYCLLSICSLIPAISLAFSPHPNEAPLMSNDDIRALMIIESNEELPCPCPYSPDAIGGQCGQESLYYRPGGYRVYCYMKDISSQEVAFYRLKRGTPFATEHF